VKVAPPILVHHSLRDIRQLTEGRQRQRPRLPWDGEPITSPSRKMKINTLIPNGRCRLALASGYEATFTVSA
jgi:hypothetical protein